MARDGFADQCIDILPAADIGFLERRRTRGRTAGSRYEIQSRFAALEWIRHDIGNDDDGSLGRKSSQRLRGQYLSSLR